MKKFLVGPKIYYGADSIDYLGKIAAQKAFIVTDQVMVKIGMADKVTKLLSTNEVAYEVFAEVEPDPSLETVEKGLSQFIEAKADLLIAIGGGSSIDVAKAILLLSTRLKSKFVEEGSIKKPTFVAIPTTSGTGSEVTSYAVVSDRKNNVKIPLSDEYMIPDIAILDENLTKTVPPSVTADTGMDVLTHALEAYVSLPSCDLTDMYAVKAIKIVFQYLLKAVKNGEDLEARGNLHLASCMAGIAFTNAALGINHSLAHAVGGKYHISHGRSNAILLPYVVGFNAGLLDGTIRESKAAEKFAKIAKELGLPASTVEEGVTSLIVAIQQVNKITGIPANIRDCKVDESLFMTSCSDLAEGALKDMCTSGNPRKVDKNDLIGILKTAYNG